MCGELTDGVRWNSKQTHLQNECLSTGGRSFANKDQSNGDERIGRLVTRVGEVCTCESNYCQGTSGIAGRYTGRWLAAGGNAVMQIAQIMFFFRVARIMRRLALGRLTAEHLRRVAEAGNRPADILYETRTARCLARITLRRRLLLHPHPARRCLCIIRFAQLCRDRTKPRAASTTKCAGLRRRRRSGRPDSGRPSPVHY